MGYTPMIQQYLEIKKQYKDSILFFRLGDFYEMFFDDAILASRLLEITLTGRDGGGENRIPMCGVPYHASEGYIGKLIEKGYKVAVCEQVENPETAKNIVKREVVRVFTPGLIFESQLLNEKANNYIAAVNCTKNGFGLAFADVSTGQFMITEFSEPNSYNKLLDEITRLRPSEIILSENMFNDLKIAAKLKEYTKAVSSFKDEAFMLERAQKKIKDLYSNAQDEIFILKHAMAVAAAGALLEFMEETQKKSLVHLEPPKLYFCEQYMSLDSFTRRNLELTTSIREGSKKYTLLWVLDNTYTAMGGRLLKTWIEQPLIDIIKIKLRQNAVKELVSKPHLLDSLAKLLKNIYDIERLAGRIVFGTANARDLIALKSSLRLLPEIKNKLLNCQSEMLSGINRDIDEMDDICSLIEHSISNDPPVDLRKGGLIKDGYNKEVDFLRRTGKENKSLLAKMESIEKERTGIKSLKIGFNKVFGYYIEVTKPNLAMVPSNYLRKQTLANAERFITEELKHYEQAILGSEEKLVNLEYELFSQVRDTVASEVKRIQKTAKAVAQLDVILSLAETAARNNYTCPEVNKNGIIKINGGRHPVIEKVMEAGTFVPNNTTLDNENRLLLITGPNMAGKSTYMRQVALIVLMAQIGSFVPAESAVIGIVDRIFTRVGASDDLAGGDSTFMVEMKECKSILDNASSKSLIIMDEVGRGTSTYDGISIAKALIEYINIKIKAKTLFSTHYHELTNMDSINGIVNYTVAVKEDNEDIVFLRKVLPGKANRSYGIHVAKLAGLPVEVLQRANEILNELETHGYNDAKLNQQYNYSSSHLKYKTTEKNSDIINQIRELDLINTTPLEALNILYDLQYQLKNNYKKNLNVCKEVPNSI